MRAVASVVRDPNQQPDLVQQALIHFWEQTRYNNHHTMSWRLQSCRFHIRHALAQGRSLDSQKRRSLRFEGEHEPDGSELLTGCDFASEEDLRQEVGARDMVNELLGRLLPPDPEILLLLSDGFPVCEIAKRLRIRDVSVSRSRKRIAAAAMELGFAPEKRRARP